MADRREEIMSAVLRRIAECEDGDTLGSIKLFLDALPELRRVPDERAVYIRTAASRAVESVAYITEIQAALAAQRSAGERRDWDGVDRADAEIDRVRARQPWPRES